MQQLEFDFKHCLQCCFNVFLPLFLLLLFCGGMQHNFLYTIYITNSLKKLPGKILCLTENETEKKIIKLQQYHKTKKFRGQGVCKNKCC